MDLAAWVKQRRVAGLLELIDQLPEASRTREAILQDRSLNHLGDDVGSSAQMQQWTPPLRDYDLHAQLLRRLINEFGAALGHNGELVPAPWSAASEQRAAAERAYADDLIRDVAPHAWRPSQ